MPRAKKIKKVESEILEDLVSIEPRSYKDDDVLECECTKVFFDKYTDKLYELGKIYKFTYKRIKEIKAKNKDYIKIIEK